MDALDQDHPALRLWYGLIGTIHALMTRHGADPARTVVLVPYAQLMPVAATLWARQSPGGPAPRFESTMNWANSLGYVAAVDDLTFDMGRDLLTARSWLAKAGLGTRADLLAGRLIKAAWQLAGVAAAVNPVDRPAWAATARAFVAAAQDAPVLALEAAVASIALEWAAASSYATDALLQDSSTRALDLLVVLEGLQAEPLVLALTGLLRDRAITLPLDVPAAFGEVRLREAADTAQEAEMAAACVMRHIEAGRVPVALPALDRALVRRIRGLLDARGVAVRDESGWKLSTTRASAHVVCALRACAWNAGSDDVLDWLKNSPAIAPPTVCALERRLRRDGLRDWASVTVQRLGERAGPDDAASLLLLLEQTNAWRAGMQRGRSLLDWLEALRLLLQACGRWSGLEEDGAGTQLLALFGLHGDVQPHMQRWSDPARRMSLLDFTAWVSDSLEAATYVPVHPAREQVVILPLNQLLGRVVGALVIAGCDELRLAPSPEPAGAWTAAQREGLGLPSRGALEASVRAGWRNAMQTPHCDLLWRRSDESGEPLLASSLVLSLQLDGVARVDADPREQRSLQALPVARPLPVSQALPIESLSASAYDDLRRCPYRFFAMRQLGLQEADEIDCELDKRDFGNWLHQVLGLFHEALQHDPVPTGPDRARLLDTKAQQVTRSMHLADDAFLPFAAAWPRMRDGYLTWLALHEATGARFEQAESRHEMTLGCVKLVGRIDRIDRLADGSLMVMDYKTEARAVTSERIKQPLEDTQLAFYGALLEQDTLTAAYVNVGERGKTELLEHPMLVEGRDQLVDGILADLAQIAGGAVLPALGEGRACDFCAARGMCRRDFWV